MMLLDGFKEILKIQKFRRIVSYTGFYCFAALVSYAYTSNTTRAGFSRADQFYASYPAGTELLTDTTKLYKAALGNCFESEDWGPIEYCIMSKHFERQGKSPYAYHAILIEKGIGMSIVWQAKKYIVHGGRPIALGNIWHTFFLMDNLMEVARIECESATKWMVDKIKNAKLMAVLDVLR